MEKITQLVFGRTTEVNEQGETVVTNTGKVIKAKGSFFFTEKADELYSKKGKEGEEQDGVTVIYNELVFGNELGLIKFWDCVLANYPGVNITKDDVMAKLQEEAEVHGLEPLFKGALEVFTQGFYKKKVKDLNFMMQLAVNKEKDPEKKAELESQIEMMEAIAVNAAS